MNEPWFVEATLQLGLRAEEEVAIACAGEARGSVVAALALTPGEVGSVLAFLAEHLPALRASVEDRALADWVRASGAVDERQLTRARQRTGADVRLADALQGVSDLDLRWLDAAPRATFECDPCGLTLELPEPLLEFVPQCPGCGAGRQGGGFSHGRGEDVDVTQAVSRIPLPAPAPMDESPQDSTLVVARPEPSDAATHEGDDGTTYLPRPSAEPAEDVESRSEAATAAPDDEKTTPDAAAAPDDEKTKPELDGGPKADQTPPDPLEAQRWVSEAAFSLWAVRKGGLTHEQLAQARATAGDAPLFEALVLAGILALDAAMDALEPEVEVVCGTCDSHFRVGNGGVEFLPELACPRCAGALALADTKVKQVGVPRQIGPYEVVRALGEGGMGAVYLAKDGAGRLAAVKVLKGLLHDDVGRRRFEREGRSYDQLDHPNLVRSLGRGYDERSRCPFIALEFVEGNDLAHLMERRTEGRLDIEEACYVIAACARGLQHAHERGIIHRDLKPANILITAGADVKLTDLGIALTSDVSQRLTAMDEVVGTPQYVPPDVLRGADWAPSSDVYALGSCAFRLLTGTPPFPGKGVVEVLQQQLDYTPLPVTRLRPEVPAPLAALVARMLAKASGQRPTLLEVLAELEALGLPSQEVIAERWREEVQRITIRPDASARADQTLARGQRFQSYRLEQELGRGGMGVVYRAFHEKLKKQVAIKVMLAGALASEADKRRFLREAEAAAAVQHPYIVPVLDAGEHDGTYYLTMDYVKGEPLTRAQKRLETDLPALLRLFCKICEGVHHAHARGIIHRDLKPDNILVDAALDPHILDFGIAKKLDPQDGGEAAAALTTEGDVIGTLRYMPPEQAAGKTQQVDVRSDVYALGSILYEVVCGVTPFRGGIHELLQQILFEEPRAPSVNRPDVPWELDAICLKALEKDRDDRYQSAIELKRDIERYLEGMPIAAQQASLTYRARKWLVRNKGRAAAAAAVALVLCGVTGWGVYQQAAAEGARRAAILDAVAEGWAQFSRREFDAATGSFRAGLAAATGDDVLVLPPGTAGRLPDDVRAALPEDERTSPRVTRDRLARWAQMAEERIRFQQANEHLAAVREALAPSGDGGDPQRLERALRAIQAARLLTPEDEDVRRLNQRVARSWAALGRAALEAEKTRGRAAFDGRAADLEVALSSFQKAQGLEPDFDEAVAGLVEVEAARRRLAEDQGEAEAIARATARLAQGQALEEEARAAGAVAAATELLERARLEHLAAFAAWAELEEAKDGYTRVSLRLAELALESDELSMAEGQLRQARLFDRHAEAVEELEARLRARDRRQRAFDHLRTRGDEAYGRGDLAAARAAYDLALAERDEVIVRRRRDLCTHLLAAEDARRRDAPEEERAALLLAAALHEDPSRLQADLQRLSVLLYERTLAAADQAYQDAQRRGAGWQEVAALYERALRFRPDGVEAAVGRADAYAERDRPPDMVLVSVPLRLLARGAAAARVGSHEVVRFYLDRTEVSNAAYARFALSAAFDRRDLWSEAGWAERRVPWPGGKPPAGEEDHPVTGVSAHDAAAYARWHGRRLPTDREWVLAACFDLRAGRERRFPWGDEVDLERAAAARQLRPVGANRGDESPWLAMDLAFNASEWVTDGDALAVRGLSHRFFRHDLEMGVLDWRKAPAASLRHPTIGFRCAADVPAPPPFRTEEE